MKYKRITRILRIYFLLLVMLPCSLTQAQTKKGLLVYDSIYGSTVEVAYWIKAIIGMDPHLDVKSLSQVITVKPYDYVIFGSLTRDEKPSKKIYKFVEENKDVLINKEVCYFLTCGDYDETMVLKAPGLKAHLIGGRNYLMDIMEKFPAIKPVVIGGFGGRQVLPNMGTQDSIRMWLVSKLAKEGTLWEGLDIWESLVMERVEAFANEVRTKVLGLEPRQDVEKFRGYWTSLQPANFANPKLKKFNPKPYTEHLSPQRNYYARSRIKGSLDNVIALVQTWAQEAGIDLREQVRTFFNIYYHGVKKYDGEEITIHIVPATFPEDPGNVHIAFRCFEKPEKRKQVERDIDLAEKLLWANGRKVED